MEEKKITGKGNKNKHSNTSVLLDEYKSRNSKLAHQINKIDAKFAFEIATWAQIFANKEVHLKWLNSVQF